MYLMLAGQPHPHSRQDRQHKGILDVSRSTQTREAVTGNLLDVGRSTQTREALTGNVLDVGRSKDKRGSDRECT